MASKRRSNATAAQVPDGDHAVVAAPAGRKQKTREEPTGISSAESALRRFLVRFRGPGGHLKTVVACADESAAIREAALALHIRPERLHLYVYSAVRA